MGAVVYGDSYCRANREEGAEGLPANQVVQYDPAHTDAINCVTTLSSDLCVSGGSDQVRERERECVREGGCGVVTRKPTAILCMVTRGRHVQGEGCNV